jgi:uncharacterized membrane protein
MSPYLLLKFLHILFAVTAVGSNFTYGFWLARAKKDPAHLAFVLKNIHIIDRFLANPAYAGLGITGPLMVWTGGYPWSAFWIWMSIVLLVLAAVVGILVYSPLLKRQITALESKGPDSAEYEALEKQSTLLGIGLCVLAGVILFLMVTKFQP